MRPITRTLLLAPMLLALSGCESWYEFFFDGRGKLLERLNGEAAKVNAASHLTFDPARDTIVNEHAEQVVLKYVLNVAYKFDGEYEGPKQHVTYRAVRYPECNRPQVGADRSYMLNRAWVPETCHLITYGEAVPHTALTTRVIIRNFEVEGYTVRRQQIVIRRPDGRYTSVFHFVGRSDGNDTIADRIAGALGLQRRTGPTDGLPGLEDVNRWIAASGQQGNAYKLGQLDSFLDADMGQPEKPFDFYAEQFDPADIGRRAEKIVRRFEAMTAQTNTVGGTGRLLARLPEAEMRQYGPRILAALARVPKREIDEQPLLILRLAEFGAAASPVLVRASEETSFIKRYAAIAACRVGASATPKLRENFLAAWKDDNSPHLTNYERRRGYRRRFGTRNAFRRAVWEQCTKDGQKYGPPASIAFSACWAYPETTSEASPTYLALKRMGLGAQADAMAKHQYSIHWKKTYASVGPQSSPKVCGADNEI